MIEHDEEQEVIEERRFKRKICRIGRKFLMVLSCFAIRSFFKLLRTEGVDCGTLEKELDRVEKEDQQASTQEEQQEVRTENKEKTPTDDEKGDKLF